MTVDKIIKVMKLLQDEGKGQFIVKIYDNDSDDYIEIATYTCCYNSIELDT